jgi:hypothetical protein
MIATQIEQAWQFYTQWAISGMPPTGMPLSGNGEEGSEAGSDQSAPGGSANNPGHMGTDLSGGSDIGAEAGATVQQADRTAESAARTTAQREG